LHFFSGKFHFFPLFDRIWRIFGLPEAAKDTKKTLSHEKDRKKARIKQKKQTWGKYKNKAYKVAD
jgi:hypothetical protein